LGTTIVQFGNAIPFINFNVTANANNQTFSNPLLSAYTSNVEMNVMKNGVNIEPELYSVSGNILTVNIPLTVGDTIDVLSTQASNGGSPGGNIYAVQFNNGTNGFAGDEGNLRFSPESTFGSEYTLTAKNLSVIGNTINRLNLSVLGNINTGSNLSVNGNLTVNRTATLGNLTSTGNVFLGNVGNVRINGGSANYLLQTDGGGILSWVDPSSASPTSLNATIANVRITGGLNGYVLQTDGTGNLTWTAQTGGGGNGVPGGSNTQVQYNDAGNFAGSATFTYDSVTDVLTANHITATNNLDITNGGGAPASGSNTTDSIILHTTGTYNTSIGRQSGSMWFSIPTGETYSWYYNGNVVANLSNGIFETTESISAPNIGSAYANISGNGASLFSIPGTAIVTDVANANYANISGSTYSVDGANVSGVVANATFAANAGYANTVDGPNVTGYVPNSDYATLAGSATTISASNVIGTVNAAVQSTYADYANSVTLANVVGAGNIASINISGSNTDVLYGNGVFGVFTVPPGGTNSQVQFNNNGVLGGVGTMTYDVGANTLNGTFANIVSLGNLTVQRAFEKYTPNATGLASSFNYDIITQSIINVTANATANTTLNFRGNSTTTIDTMLSNNQSVTLVLLSKIGTTPYIINTVQVDSVSITPKYLGGLSPLVGTRQSNVIQSYTYTILKSAANTFTVLGSFAEFV
jgi:hypothetical protein